MKAIDLKLKKAEQRAIRLGARKQAKKLLSQACKFRADALKAGLKEHELGGKVYKEHHPIYQEMVLPLLEEATRIASTAGFDILLQVRTPLSTEPYFTHCIGGFQDENDLTPTMKAQVDLIRSRPVLGGKPGLPEVKSREEISPAAPTE